MVRPRAKLQTTFLDVERKIFHFYLTSALCDGWEIIRDVTGTAHINAVVGSTWEHRVLTRAVQEKQK